MATAKRKSKVYTISVPPDLAKQAESIARNESRTMSEVFREGIRSLQREQVRRVLLEGAAYGATRNPHGYTEEDVPRVIKEVRADTAAKRKLPAG